MNNTRTHVHTGPQLSNLVDRSELVALNFFEEFGLDVCPAPVAGTVMEVCMTSYTALHDDALSQVFPIVCCVLQLARDVSTIIGKPPKPVHCPAWPRVGTLLDTVAECYNAPVIGGLLVPGLAKGFCSPAVVQLDRGTGKILKHHACTTTACESVPGESTNCLRSSVATLGSTVRTRRGTGHYDGGEKHGLLPPSALP